MKKRIVVKFGTGVLTTNASGLQLDSDQFTRLGSEIANLIAKGHSLTIISSAAVAAGVAALNWTTRPSSLPAKQACAAVGQSQLMQAYERALTPHRLTVAQLLLTHGDIDSRQRRDNAKTTLEALHNFPQVVPIINENDSIAVEELRFGDNDRLGAEVAQLVRADLFLILTGSDGLIGENQRIPLVTDLSKAHQHVTDEKDPHGTGGMGSKLEAVGLATAAGIDSWILDGRQPNRIAAAIAGQNTGTRFPAKL